MVLINSRRVITYGANAILLVSFILAGLLSNWWIFLLGSGVWLAFLPSLVLQENQTVSHNPKKWPVLPARFETPFLRIVYIQEAIHRTVEAFPKSRQPKFHTLIHELDLLMEEIHFLCEEKSGVTYNSVDDLDINADISFEMDKITAQLISIDQDITRLRTESSALDANICDRLVADIRRMLLEVQCL